MDKITVIKEQIDVSINNLANSIGDLKRSVDLLILEQSEYPDNNKLPGFLRRQSD